MPFNDPGLKMQWHYDNDGTMTNAEGETVAVEGAISGCSRHGRCTVPATRR